MTSEAGGALVTAPSGPLRFPRSRSYLALVVPAAAARAPVPAAAGFDLALLAVGARLLLEAVHRGQQARTGTGDGTSPAG